MSKTTAIPEVKWKWKSTAPDLGFEIVSLEYLENLRPPEDHNPFELHRLDFFIVLINTGNKLDHQIDFSRISLNNNQIAIIGKGQIHAFDKVSGFSGKLLLFTEDFLQQHLLPSTVSRVRDMYNHPGDPIIYDLNDRLEHTLQELQEELMSGKSEPSSVITASLLTIFLLSLEKQHNPDQTRLFHSESYALFLRFKVMVESEFMISRDASYFAGKLNITYKHLNAICRKSTGKTAKVIIDDLILLEARRLLLCTSMSSKQIAYTCGFEEPSNFTKFFKKRMEVTPAQFRNEYKVRD